MESKWTLRDQTEVGVVNNKQTILKRKLSTKKTETILEWRLSTINRDHTEMGVDNNKQRPY